jgi:4-aminobutyrate aminotransferase-like enzyme/Ser/Thr protein kinase RdoA (MazF antagonist)
MSGSPSPGPDGLDGVIATGPPAFDVEQAVGIALATYGVAAASAVDLGSERDQTFLLRDGAGAGLAVMKVSNPAEDPATLDMEALVVERIAQVDPDLPVARPWRAAGSGPDGSAGPAAFRAAWPGGSGSGGSGSGAGQRHWVRMYDLLPGHQRLDPVRLTDRALGDWGETTARLGRGMRGFAHPRALRVMPWDVQHTARCRPMLAAVDADLRGAVGRVLDRWDDAVAPAWPALRAQVVHGDLTADNALVDDDGRITGIVDFGDMSHTALLVDLSSVLDSVAAGREPGELFRVARLVLDGYQRVTPLEPLELRLLGELWAARCAVGILVASWRAATGLEDPGFATRYVGPTAVQLDELLTAGWDRLPRLLGEPGGATAVAGADAGADAGARPGLAARRDRVLGPAMEPLSYADPVRPVAARGVWVTDADGRQYLDMYNNVPCVGHAHPRVAEAVARQARLLQTNLRYLHASAVELAERLVATCPPGLDTVFFVNSGSEANDLAWRLATGHTGNAGGLCTAHAYHGITAAVADLSPEILGPDRLPAHVERWTPPDAYRGTELGTDGFRAALDRLAGRGVAPALVILDGVLQSDGVLDLEPGYVQQLHRLTREAGGLWVADEVQGGHGRTGSHLWSFERFGIEPDLVTLGKPMGNGQPVGAVITRREIAASLAADTSFFSTFGGNQVCVLAAQAVLDVLDDERVLPRVTAAGEALRDAVRQATDHDDRVGDVRGVGLANGIELVTDRGSTRPAPAVAAALKEELRRRGVLVGTTGPAGNVLKVRPPLAFTADLAPRFAGALAEALARVPAGIDDGSDRHDPGGPSRKLPISGVSWTDPPTNTR